MPVASAASMGRCCGKTPNSPSTLGAVSSLTASLSFSPSGVTISSAMVSAISRRLRLQLGSRFLCFFDVADHVKRLLGQIVEGTGQDLFEAGDGLFQWHVLAGATRELLGHEERLGQEALDFAGARPGGAGGLAGLLPA